MLKIGHQALITINDGHATLRLARRADHPDRISFYIYNRAIESVAADLLPLPTSSGWMSLQTARSLKSTL